MNSQRDQSNIVRLPVNRHHADPCPKCGRLTRSFIDGRCPECAKTAWADRPGWWEERRS